MDWILASIAALAAAAAVVSALASRNAASDAVDTYRPHIAVTGNKVDWSGTKATMQLFITNPGPAPGRITGQHNIVTLPDGTRLPSGGETTVNVIYPAEREPISFRLGIEVGCTVEVELDYEDLARKRKFLSRIKYRLPDSPGDPTIQVRDGN